MASRLPTACARAPPCTARRWSTWATTPWRAPASSSFAREIENFAPHYLEEMRGIAAGADVPFEDIVMVNARTEVIAKARAEKKKAAELELATAAPAP